MRHRNLKVLVTEMYRINNDMTPEIVTRMLPLRPQGQYKLRNWSDFTLTHVRTVTYGIKSIRFFGPKPWKRTPANMKKVNTTECLKSSY